MKIEFEQYDHITAACLGNALLAMAEQYRAREAQMNAQIEQQRVLLAQQTAADGGVATPVGAATEAEALPTEDGEAEAPRKRGRPKGSTNKPKEPELVPEPAPVVATPAPVVESPAPAAFGTPVEAAKAYHAKFGLAALATLVNVRYKGTRAGELAGDDATAFVKDVQTALEFGVPYGPEDAR